MKINRINIKGFRLLQDVTLCLEDRTTVVVGRNNSGKTSLTELFRRLLSDKPTFHLEDFNLAAYEAFWNAFTNYNSPVLDKFAVHQLLPTIEVEFSISYQVDDENLGVLSHFIIDLDVDSTEAVALVRYQLREGGLEALFGDFAGDPTVPEAKGRFFKLLKDRLPKMYEVSLFALDPTDESRKNQKRVDLASLRRLLKAGFIYAQRGLDDTTHKEKDVLGKVLSRLFENASHPGSDKNRIALKLESAVQEIQTQMGGEFGGGLKELLPALKLFGYPGLSDSGLHTETTLDVERLLSNHTRILYEGRYGIGLPETYNGLGSRNLIYILFQLYEFYKAYQSMNPAPSVHVVFIEEPEAHLHPQMQEVFVRQLDKIVEAFLKENQGSAWPVQFVITTHSTHMANEAPFDSIRYFLSKNDGERHTVIKDLRTHFTQANSNDDKEFLNKYMTLTRCDLFFADKAILIEGSTERLLLPCMIHKVDEEGTVAKLASQYISVIEVGGAFAHKFYRLLDFLELPTLIVTDLDSVTKSDRKKCKVSEGERTSNACITDWFCKEISPSELIEKSDNEKVAGVRRIAYQIPETVPGPCGRSFEDAFLLLNGGLEGDDEARAEAAWVKAQEEDKLDFAMEYAFKKTDWQVPRYIKEGLQWLAVQRLQAEEPPHLLEFVEADDVEEGEVERHD